MKYLSDIKQQEMVDRLHSLDNKQQFKKDYTDYNIDISKEKHKLQTQQLDERKNEKFSFFPFNEGERVEKQRAEQKSILNRELRERSRQINMPQLLSENGQMRDKSAQNRLFVNSNEFIPQNSVEFDYVSTPLGSAAYGSPNRGNKPDLPDSFKKTYPRFLEPHKHYPYRRLKDDHIEKVMQDAVKRVEDDLKVSQFLLPFNYSQTKINE